MRGKRKTTARYWPRRRRRPSPAATAAASAAGTPPLPPMRRHAARPLRSAVRGRRRCGCLHVAAARGRRTRTTTTTSGWLTGSPPILTVSIYTILFPGHKLGPVPISRDKL
jgi:hypothetical protein